MILYNLVDHYSNLLSVHIHFAMQTTHLQATIEINHLYQETNWNWKFSLQIGTMRVERVGTWPQLVFDCSFVLASCYCCLAMQGVLCA